MANYDDLGSVARLPIAQPIRVFHRLGQRLEPPLAVKVGVHEPSRPVVLDVDLVVAEIGGEPHAHRHGRHGNRFAPVAIPRAAALSGARGVRRGSLGREPFKQSRRSVHGLLPGVLTLITDVADVRCPSCAVTECIRPSPLWHDGHAHANSLG